MPLDKGEIRVPFGGGLDTKTDYKQVIPGKLLELKNGTFQNLRQITKREAFEAAYSLDTVDGNTIDAGWAIYRRGRELVTTSHVTNTDVGRVSWEDGNCMFSHDPGDDEWKKIGTREPVSLDVETIYKASGDWIIPDVALADSAQYACYVWAGTDPSLLAIPTTVCAHASVVNLANDSTIIDDWAYTAAAVQGMEVVHVTGLDYGTTHRFYVWISNAPNIYLSIIDTATLSAAGAANLKIADLATVWDVCTSIYDTGSVPCSVLAYKENVGNEIDIDWVDYLGNVIDTAHIAEVPANTAITVFDAYDRLTATNKVVVAWQRNSDGFIRAAVYNTDGSLYTAAHTVLAFDAGDVYNITGCKDTAADHYNWATRSYLRYYIEVSPDYDRASENYILQAQCEFDGGNALQLNTMRRACLASKAWEHDSKARVWICHDSWCADLGTDPPGQYDHPAIQDTYFLKSTEGDGSTLGGGNQDEKDRTDARCLYTQAGGMREDHSLSAVVSPVTNKYLFAGRRKDVLVIPEAGWAYTSIVGIETTFGEVAQPSTELGPCIQTGGGFVGCADGRFQELNFHLYPECVWHTESGGTSTVAADWWYVVVYEWTDREGQRHQSAPSQPYHVEVDDDDTQITVWVAVLFEGDYEKGINTRCVLYRTENGGTVFYRLPETVHVINDRTAANYVSMVDPPTTDAVLVENETLYTGTVQNGVWDIVENICPPASSIMNVRQDRVFLVADDDRTNIWFSKIKQHRVGTSFSDLFTKRITDGGDITALSTMDTREIVFKEAEIRAFSGNGPIDTGKVGSFSEDYLITSDVGCCDRASVVWTDKGIMFKSLKGIYLLGRNLQVTYIGAPVEEYNQYKVLKAELVETKNQVRFLLEDNIAMLVYDYLVDQWSVFESPYFSEVIQPWGTVDSAMWQNQYVMIRDDGTVLLETSNYRDISTTYIPLDLTTAWIKLNGLQGYQRVWWFSLLGEVYDYCTINYEIYYNYVDANPQTGSVVVNAAFAADPPAQFRIKPRYGEGKCQAFKVRLYDATAVGATNYKGFAISDLMIQIGKKPGVMRQGITKTR